MGTNKKKAVAKKASKTPKTVAAKKVTKKVISKKVVTKKVAVKKVVAKKTVAKKTVAKKPSKKVSVKKIVAKKISLKAEPKKATVSNDPKKKTKSAPPAKKDTEKKSLLKTTHKKNVSTSVSKTKEMKKEDKENTSKEATPNVQKNMPLLKQEPAYLQRTMNAPKDDRTHYSKEELNEFDAIISEKLELARKQFQFAKDVLNRKNDEGTDNTTGNVKMLEDGADVLEKESFSSFAARQQKFILQLENAHARIKNGTYGICIVTGKLIPKERLKLVPHTQHTIEAKEQRK
jgi:RNA polymerase-binding transcription factor DksA